ncbi:MAG: hypothetical protein JSW26_17780 [Desulfobacterales bacterium]|nr:MAG: hypothetical protein JSW26_17780 [Desulfobacterales bacterium]
MVEIRVYGKLRRYVQDNTIDSDNVIRITPDSDETLDMLLSRLGIPLEEIYSIFFNSKLLAARSGMAKWLGYRQVRTDPFDWDLNVTLKLSDRVGLFGRDMAALVV